ncbi:MAG: PKD domain-containing protein [Candidatus Hydrogenedentes bacterium]|nr:PKD domain-containing protein [Candidatus Hydrogenedentota bacterium]
MSLLRQFAFALTIMLVLVVQCFGDEAKGTGRLQVKLVPTEAVSAGAQWRADGGAWQNSGTKLRNVSPGEHTISCKPVDGWKTPRDTIVTVVAGETTKSKRRYKPQGLPAPLVAATPLAGPPPLEIKFSGDANDPSVSAPTYQWSFGDGSVSSEKDPVYTFPVGTAPGRYEITFTVTDDSGAQRVATIPITITAGVVAASETVQTAAIAEIMVTDAQSPISGASVVIPKGAVPEPLVVTVGEDTTTPSEWLGRAPLVELGPEGTTFNKPVSVTVPVSPDVADPGSVHIVAYDTAFGSWTSDGITDVQYLGDESRLISFKTTHFTFFSTLDTWTIQDLGTLGGTTTYAFSINDNSQVTGYSYPFVSANWRHALLWESGNSLLDIHDTTDKHSYGFAINAATPLQIAGYTQLEDYDSNFAAFVWDATNGMQELGTLGGTSAQAWGINDSGVVVGQSTLVSGLIRAFQWTSGGGMFNLGTLGGDNSVATAVNNSGQVVGWAQDNGTNKDASFRWTSGGGMVKLQQFSGAKYSYALGINAGGNSVGEAQTGNNGPIHAALWTGTTQVTDLGTLGGVSSVARAINDSNQVVGSSLTVSGTTRAFGWDNTGTAVMTNLNDLLPGGSGWVLSEAWDINNSGEIVGYGTKAGLTRAFLLKKN